MRPLISRASAFSSNKKGPGAGIASSPGHNHGRIQFYSCSASGRPVIASRIAVRILKPLHSFDNIRDWILYHHERVDGKGYYKLKADEIPLAARIIAITDTYSAIRMQRSYKDAKTYEEAMAIIKEVGGTQLDQELLDIFVNIPKEELEKCMPEKVNYHVEP